jgi:perosamine synthetase
MALRALGIGPGDEVLVPNFTFIASANAVEMCGAKPVFVDIKEDLHIDIEKCKLSLTRKTKAIMPVHIYGMACNMPEIMEFAKNHKLLVIEDAAQAIGVKWGKKHAGTFGQVGSFSFFADKTITTGEGGLVVTNDKKIYERLQFIRNQGRINRGSFVHPEIGYNFRMTDIQSAIGLSQLEKLPEIIEKKSTILFKVGDIIALNTGVEKIRNNGNPGAYNFALQSAMKSIFYTTFIKKREVKFKNKFLSPSPLERGWGEAELL